MKSFITIITMLFALVLSSCGSANRAIQSTYWDANTATAQSEGDYKTALWRARNHLGDKEISDSLYNLGRFLRVKDRKPEAIKYLKESIEVEKKISSDSSLRSGRRYAELSMAYLMGENINEARPYVERLKGIPFSGDEQKVVNKIISEFDKMMSSGEAVPDETPQDPKEIFELATQYEDGRGVKQDIQEAIRLYKLSSSKGFSHADYYLGVMYDKARGVERNDVEAREWYQKAAEKGHAKGQFNYAVFLLQGRGGEADEVLAKKYITLSSKQGYEAATRVLRKHF